MQVINENKLLHHLDRASGDFRPITADVFLTNFCNNKCSWCTYNRWELDDKSVGISYENFVKHAERLLELGVKAMILTGGGEPTINKDFDKITAYLEERGIPYGINTNLNRLRYFKPDYLKVSLDGFDEDSYENVRKVRAYERVRENIIKYAEWKKENSPKTNLGIQMVVTNPDDVRKFYEANKDLPVDYIVFRPIESTNGGYYNNPKNMLDAGKAIKRVKALNEVDSRVILNYKWNLLQQRFETCVAHWAQIALDEKGNVIYCCHKPYEIVGHILDDNILEKYAAAHTDMKMCDVPCRLTAPNMFMEKVNEPTKNVSFI